MNKIQLRAFGLVFWMLYAVLLDQGHKEGGEMLVRFENQFNEICEEAKNVSEGVGKVEWKRVGGDVVAGYCKCGMELDRCHDYEPAQLPNFCPECGRKVVE